jgi:capsular exopolysaccharide synthesis family protein
MRCDIAGAGDECRFSSPALATRDAVSEPLVSQRAMRARIIQAMSLFSRSKPDTKPLDPATPGDATKVKLVREELVLATAPRGAHAEQFRGLRNSLMALNPEGAPRTLVLTSASAREGKTVATLNLALALAELPNTRVLVVDANLHQPAVESYLGLQRKAGLCDLLDGRCAPDQAIRATSVEGVSVLGAGTLPHNPSVVLGSERMKALLATLKRQHSWVLIDTPEASTISDASMLGAMVDGIVLVVRLGETPRHMVEQVHNTLESLGGNVLGTLLTGGHEQAG